VIAASERPGALNRVSRVRRCPGPPSRVVGRWPWAEASALQRADRRFALSSLHVRKLRNRKPSQLNPDTAGPAAALAVPSGTTIMSPAGPLARRSRLARALMRGTLAVLSALLIAGVLAPLTPSPASASTRSQRLTALRWAERQAGKWYCFGGTGGCFDCSGLVMSA
jgi:cell wall-associated NlpC family hydrolase